MKLLDKKNYFNCKGFVNQKDFSERKRLRLHHILEKKKKKYCGQKQYCAIISNSISKIESNGMWGKHYSASKMSTLAAYQGIKI